MKFEAFCKHLLSLDDGFVQMNREDEERVGEIYPFKGDKITIVKLQYFGFFRVDDDEEIGVCFLPCAEFFCELQLGAFTLAGKRVGIGGEELAEVIYNWYADTGHIELAEAVMEDDDLGEVFADMVAKDFVRELFSEE